MAGPMNASKRELRQWLEGILPGEKKGWAQPRREELIGGWQVIVEVTGDSVEVLASTCEAGHSKEHHWSYSRNDPQARRAVIEALIGLAND